jgi:hypothetical protein
MDFMDVGVILQANAGRNHHSKNCPSHRQCRRIVMNHRTHDEIQKKSSFKDPDSGIAGRLKHITGMSGRPTTNTQKKSSKTNAGDDSQVHHWNPAEMGDSRIRGVESIRSTYFDTEFENDEWVD